MSLIVKVYKNDTNGFVFSRNEEVLSIHFFCIIETTGLYNLSRFLALRLLMSF